MTRKKKHQSTFLKKEERAFWGFISPWLIGFILLTFGPMLYSFYASFTNWNGIKAPEFIGLENYRRMFMDDEKFLISLKNTAVYTVISVPVNLIISRPNNLQIAFISSFRMCRHCDIYRVDKPI